MPSLNHSLRLSRRAALASLAAGGAAFALFGPRGAKESTRGRIVLDYWEKWTGHEGLAMQRIVDRFNDSQSRIFVRYLVTAGIDQKTLVAIAGGDPPDIVGLWNYNVPAFAEANAILPLDDMARAAGLSLDDYASGVRPIMLHQGKWWAIINTAGTIALYWNKSVFRDAGLDPDRPPRTIEELDDLNRRLTLPAPPSRAPVQRTGYLHAEPGWWPSMWGYYFGGSIYDPKADRSLAASPENLAAYRWMQSYPLTLTPEREQQFRAGFGNYDSPLNAFLSGKLAMVLQGPWLANVIRAYKPDLDYAVAPFPVLASLFDPAAPIGLIDTDILVIPRGVPHPEACMEFIAFTQRRDNVEELATAHCKNSPLAHSSESFFANHPNRGVRVHDAIAKSPRSFLCPRTPTWLQFKAEFDASAEIMWTCRGTPDQVLPSLQQRTQAMLDRAADQRRRRAALKEHA